MYDKKALFTKLCDQLEAMIEEAKAARHDAESESRSHKGAMESRYDTFKEEAQALAGGHGKRELDLRRQLIRIKSLTTEGHAFALATAVQTGSVVRIKDHDAGEELRYLIVNAAGGLKLEHESIQFVSLSFTSPLGRALLRKETGDFVVFQVEGRKRSLEILEIQ